LRVGIRDVGKRVLLGRKLRSTQLGETLLPKRIALPVFASDALSSVAYAPDEILLTLSVAGTTAYAWSWKIALVVALVMLTVIASYRQNVHAYPSGGGDYEVATVNIGPTAGLVVAAALLVDYVLTVAVSISSGVQNAASAIGAISGHEALVASALVLILMAVNLRGVKESGTAFAIPTYCFMACIVGMTVYGLYRASTGSLPSASSARFHIEAATGAGNGLAGAGMAWLLAKSFSSGCAALTGVEAISNGVPAFRKPKSQNAATTLLLLGTIAVTMLVGIVVLTRLTHLKMADATLGSHLVDPRTGRRVGPGYDQHTVIGQLAKAVFSTFPPAFYLTIAATGVILVLAANTAFNGFPVLASILARDGFMPRQLRSRGDRLAFSNGIIVLALLAMLLILAFNAEVTRLIQLYIIGVFVSFTLSQFGMIRHWTRHLKGDITPGDRRRMLRSRAINTFGLGMTAVVLCIVLATKFLAGAYLAIIAMAVLFFLMRAIRHHYDLVGRELAAAEDDAALPSRIHAVILVSKVHKPTLRAVAYARAGRPNTVEAVTVDVDPESTAAVLEAWDEARIPIRLRVLESPYREITRPVLDYVRDLRRRSPRDIVMVYIPEYVVGRWWEQALHNHSAFRLKTRLILMPGVMVTSVPFQLRSSEAAQERADRKVEATAAPGAGVRHGDG
jgi:amino acid transporter